MATDGESPSRAGEGGGEDATTVNPRQQSQQSTPQRFKKIYFVNALTL